MPLDRQEPYRARHLVWPGASNQSGAGAGTHLAWLWCRGAYCCKVALPWRPHAYTPRIIRCRGAGGGISCAVGDSGPPRDGREPSWARPCEASGALYLSNGGSGGGHETCTLWPPPAPFGYFPARGKYLVRPQAGETSHKKQTSCGRQETGLPFFFRIAKGFASAEATKGLSDRPLETFGAHRLKRMEATRNRFLVEGKGKSLSFFFCFSGDFASAEATKGLSGRPLETFGVPPLERDGGYKKWIFCGRQGKAPPCFLFC